MLPSILELMSVVLVTTWLEREPSSLGLLQPERRMNMRSGMSLVPCMLAITGKIVPNRAKHVETVTVDSTCSRRAASVWSAIAAEGGNGIQVTRRCEKHSHRHRDRSVDHPLASRRGADRPLYGSLLRSDERAVSPKTKKIRRSVPCLSRRTPRTWGFPRMSGSDAPSRA